MKAVTGLHCVWGPATASGFQEGGDGGGSARHAQALVIVSL